MITVQKKFYMLSAVMAATAMLSWCAFFHVSDKKNDKSVKLFTRHTQHMW
jgi:hypothetical protein